MSNSLEFTPGGLAPAGASYSVKLEDLTPADPRLFSPPPARVQSAPVKQRAAGTEPLDVLKAARARLKFVRSEVKKLRKLEQEEAQLKRLLAAAARPMATVRSLKTSAG